MRGISQWRDPKAGMTLVEVTLALLLISFLAALALPGLVRATGSGQLRVAAMQVSALLRDGRNVAQNSGRPTSIYVEEGRRVRSGTSQAVIDMPVGAIASLRTPIRFFPDGRSSGGDLVLATQSARYVIDVSPDTGAIRVAAP